MKGTKVLSVMFALLLLTSFFSTRVTYLVATTDRATTDRWYGIAEPKLGFIRGGGDSITGIKAYTMIYDNNIRKGFTAYYIAVILQDFVGEFFPEWIQLGWIKGVNTDYEIRFYVDWWIDQQYGLKYLDVPAVAGKEYLLTIEMPYPAETYPYVWNAYIDGVEVASLKSERGWAVTLRGESYYYWNQMEGRFWGLSYKSADGLASESVGEWHSWNEVKVHVYSAWYDSSKGKLVTLHNTDDFTAPYYAYPLLGKTKFLLVDRRHMSWIVREYIPRKSKPFRPAVIYRFLFNAFTEERWL